MKTFRLFFLSLLGKDVSQSFIRGCINMNLQTCELHIHASDTECMIVFSVVTGNAREKYVNIVIMLMVHGVTCALCHHMSE